MKSEDFGYSVSDSPPQGGKLLKKSAKTSSTGYKNPFNYVNNIKAKSSNANKKKGVAMEDKSPPPLSFYTKNKWVCMICNETTLNKQKLIEHYEHHKNEKDDLKEVDGNDLTVEDFFKCVMCTKEFTSSSSYDKHLEAKHGENRYACEQCDKHYKNSYQLCLHNFKIHSSEEGKYKCITCDFSTSSKFTLKAHMDKHEVNKQLKCEICDREFLTASCFEEHKNSHVDAAASSFQCEICGSSFSSSGYLMTHKKSVHPHFGLRTNNKCHLCEKQFAHKKSLILHLRSHTGENAVLCDMCGKSLSSSEHLKQHLRIHTGYKPHVCAVCGKGFAKKSNLTLHDRVHSGEKPYICRDCGKCFSQRSSLVIHLRYHSGERPYTCQLCNKGFVAKGLLGVHFKSCSRIVE